MIIYDYLLVDLSFRTRNKKRINVSLSAAFIDLRLPTLETFPLIPGFRFSTSPLNPRVYDYNCSKRVRARGHPHVDPAHFGSGNRGVLGRRFFDGTGQCGGVARTGCRISRFSLALAISPNSYLSRIALYVLRAALIPDHHFRFYRSIHDFSHIYTYIHTYLYIHCIYIARNPNNRRKTDSTSFPCKKNNSAHDKTRK